MGRPDAGPGTALFVGSGDASTLTAEPDGVGTGAEAAGSTEGSEDLSFGSTDLGADAGGAACLDDATGAEMDESAGAATAAPAAVALSFVETFCTSTAVSAATAIVAPAPIVPMITSPLRLTWITRGPACASWGPGSGGGGSGLGWLGSNAPASTEFDGNVSGMDTRDSERDTSPELEGNS